MPSCGQSVNLWLWRCCLFVLFLHGTLTSPWLRSDHLMIIWGLILTLVWIISLLSLVWHAGAAAGVVEVGNLTHLCAFQPGGEVAVAPSLLYIPAGRLKPPTVPRRGLPSPAPNTAFACISLSLSLSLSLQPLLLPLNTLHSPPLSSLGKLERISFVVDNLWADR